MRLLIISAILILSGCSTKKEAVDESAGDTDSVTVAQIEATPEPSFILNDLLKYDSEAALKKAFGDQVERSTGYYPEGMGEYTNALLFSGTTNQVEFVWLDDSVSFSGLDYITIMGEETEWKTVEGITLGTTLKELERLNNKAFTFSGFGWDYGGAVNWDNGQLQESGIFVGLDYPGDAMPPEFEGLLGDHVISSDAELAQKANPVVFEIIMKRK